MTSNPSLTANAPLGVGRIISESFSILFRNIVPVMVLGFVPSLIGLLISIALNGTAATFGLETADPFAGTSVAGSLISTILQLVIQGITIALLVQLAYDAKLGNPVTPGQYISPAIRAVVPIAVLSLVIGILASIGFLLLIIPGLIIYAMYSVTTPAIMIERVGFGGMTRSAQLTKEYRWPIIGAIILLGLCMFGISFATMFVVGLLIAALGVGTVGIGVGIVVFALLTAFTYGLTGIGSALIYARLREIKEGVSVDKLAAVFD